MTQWEQRRGPRVAKRFLARFRIQGTAGQWLMSPLKDVSQGGARFLCENHFLVGSTLEMQVTLPTSQTPMNVLAKVMWTKPGPLECVEHGVAFEPMPPAALSAFEVAIQFIMKKPRQR